ncbi:TIGR02680 family protein [Nocardiopsis sp. NPDC050513]|uniref:TIGR02680 family protein n=1 Tax=Nocardiopsis sp. NPDC050513 TaxID=3364338 RepID=UPI0037A3AECA
MTVSLTEHGAGRWRPSRAGILNVWRYYRETLAFHRGRLLLRGRNGTGKSKALELLLPFLLDASLRPNRLSTFGGSERVMHWNMIGHGYPGATRVGYVWLEFERPGPDGTGHLTLGARLQATRDVSSVRATYFTCAARVDDTLSLLTPEQQPLTVKQLKEAVEETGAGTVYPGPEEYRSAVRSLLYPRLDQARYDSLITALLQLRTPKLSERLDPGLLSSLLSSALPPLGRGELADIAGGFERLDRHREELRKLDGEVRAAKALADRQRVYAARVVRGAAAGLISATTDMDRCAREAGEADRRAEQAQEQLARSGAREEELNETYETVSAELQGLKDSAAYQAGAGIEHLRERVDAAGEEAVARAAEATRHVEAAARLAEETRSLSEVAARGRRAVGTARADAVRAAERADTAGLLREGAEALDAEGPEAVGRVRDLLRAAVEHRGFQIDEVLAALSVYHERLRRREELETDLGELAEELVEAEQLGERAARAHRDALEEFAEALTVWARGCVELPVDAPEELVGSIAPDSGAGPRTLVATARQRAGETLAALREAAVQRAERAGTVRAEIAGRIRELESADEVAPPAPRTRAADRSGRPGAPLWRLVAFADGVPANAQAGVEAALEASGLLDAWVMPDGTVPADVVGDTLLGGAGLRGAGLRDTGLRGAVLRDTVSAAIARPVPGPSLLDVLTVEEDAPVPADRVRSLLAGIAYTAPESSEARAGNSGSADTRAAAAGPASARSTTAGSLDDRSRGAGSAHSPATSDRHSEPPVRVGADGRWRLGPLHGHWSKAEPAHIGSLARERARARAIAELTERREALDRECAEAEAEREVLDGRRRRLDAETAAMPADTGTRASAQDVRSAQERIADRRGGLDRRRRRLADHEPRLSAAEQDLNAIAARHRLPADRDALDGSRAALRSLGKAVETWLDGQASQFGTEHELRRVQELSGRTREEAARAERAADEAEATRRGLTSRLAALDATVGVEHRRVQERVTACERRLTDTRRELTGVRARQLALQHEHGELLGEVRTLRDRSTEAVAARDTAADRFRALWGTPLHEDSGLAVSLPDEPTVRGTLEAARTVAATSDKADHAPERISAARARVAEAVHGARDVLARRTYLELLPDGEVQQVSALLDGVRVGARGLHARLAEEQRVRSSDLTEEERALFDRVLTGDTRRHLADRLRRATGLVASMNERLARVRTASRIAVRLRWEVAPDAPTGTQNARDLLVRDPRQLSDAERDVLHVFFRERIDDARSEDSAASWEEHLSQVLDYTSWHRFVVELDKDDGAGWKPLTRRAHGQLSGGEKAIALHLPLFAAVAAHYATDPGAPRFILLDEVFVGVDTANRGQIFALLVDLGLDLVLTSDHEWCTYAELDGIAIHQLIPAEPDEEDDAVTTARWVWTGTALEESETEGTGAESSEEEELEGEAVG